MLYINTDICSKNFNQGVYDIRWRYHIDEIGMYWYNYDDVTTMLAIKRKVACKLYDEFLIDTEKVIFYDSNNDSPNYCSIPT